MPKSKKPYTEIDHIREDLDSLKHNVIELTRHVTKDGNEQAAQLRDNLKGQIDQMQKNGLKRYKKVEAHVKQKPGQSLAMAFGAGLIASMLLSRR